MIAGFKQKIGLWDKDLISNWTKKKDWIWFHAVSVGELNAVWPLVVEINNEKPQYPVMISCTTYAGFTLANKLSKEKGFIVFYFPFDIPWIIKKLLSYARVKTLIITETEIWPFTLLECKKKNIKVFLVSAKISDRSFKNYLKIRLCLKSIINLFKEIYPQSDKDTKKFLQLGVKKEKIFQMGNIKFSTLESNKKLENKNHKETINIIFASTHPGEDQIAVEVYEELIKEFPNIKLTIAPRHLTRVEEIKKIISSYNFNPILKTTNKKIQLNKDILILDTIGELNKYYEASQISVLCGSFTKIGGHNILEPIRAGSYTIIGPYDFKIESLTQPFKENNAIVQVKDKIELLEKIKEAILNEDLRNERIQNGINLIEKNKNVLNDTKKRILQYI